MGSLNVHLYAPNLLLQKVLLSVSCLLQPPAFILAKDGEEKASELRRMRHQDALLRSDMGWEMEDIDTQMA